MTGMSIQFHALPEELLPIFAEAVTSDNLHVFAVRFPPFSIAKIEPSRLGEAFADPSIWRFKFTMSPVDLAKVTNGNEFLDMNPDALILDIGPKREQGLRESRLSTMADVSKKTSPWAKIAMKLRAITKTGAISVNPDNGASGKARGHRFSKGARALELSGVPMVSLTGSARFLLHD
jgi:hypothetical protein